MGFKVLIVEDSKASREFIAATVEADRGYGGGLRRQRLRGAQAAAAPPLRPDHHRHQHARHQRAGADQLREEEPELPGDAAVHRHHRGRASRTASAGMPLGASRVPGQAVRSRRASRALLQKYLKLREPTPATGLRPSSSPRRPRSLEGLSRDLLALDERRGEEPDPELLNGIFRAAHSLKGLAGMFGQDADRPAGARRGGPARPAPAGQGADHRGPLDLLLEAVERSSGSPRTPPPRSRRRGTSPRGSPRWRSVWSGWARIRWTGWSWRRSCAASSPSTRSTGSARRCGAEGHPVVRGARRAGIPVGLRRAAAAADRPAPEAGRSAKHAALVQTPLGKTSGIAFDVLFCSKLDGAALSAALREAGQRRCGPCAPWRRRPDPSGRSGYYRGHPALCRPQTVRVDIRSRAWIR